jgi:predicted translin family RNA/ssDNA-binding protein
MDIFLNESSWLCICQGDVASINLCLNVVTELNAKMLEFDFRNGPLRRKYDGLKYAVRNIEDILFELSLQSHEVASPLNTDEEVGSPTKRMRLTDTGAQGTASDAAAAVLEDTATEAASAAFRYVDSDEIDAIRARMDKYDQLRELVIKDSRDVQKLSKQAVYAVVRGQLQEARKKLDQAAKCADKIMETVNEVSVTSSIILWKTVA